MEDMILVLSMVLLTTIVTFIIVIYMLMTRKKLINSIKKFENIQKNFSDELINRLCEISRPKNGKK